jgi:hypothetical protein
LSNNATAPEPPPGGYASIRRIGLSGKLAASEAADAGVLAIHDTNPPATTLTATFLAECLENIALLLLVRAGVYRFVRDVIRSACGHHE